MKKILLICISFFWFSIVQGECELTELVGWTIIEVKTISGYKDDGEEKEGGWKGCQSGRIVYFTDGTTTKCYDYNYSYSIFPTAVILGRKMKGVSKTLFQMCVEGELSSIGN